MLRSETWPLAGVALRQWKQREHHEAHPRAPPVLLRTAANVMPGLPEAVKPAAMVAIGRPGDPASLPGELAEKNRALSGRESVEAISCEGRFRL